MHCFCATNLMSRIKYGISRKIIGFLYFVLLTCCKNQIENAGLPGEKRQTLNEKKGSTIAEPANAKVRKNPTTTELRGVWITNVDSEVLFSTQKTTEALNILSDLNFNTIYPVVWNKGETLYPSAAAQAAFNEKISAHPLLRNRDSLKEITEIGRKLDFKIYPWLEYGMISPVNSSLSRRHPDWLTQTSAGVKGDANGWGWLNPVHPDVQNFIVAMAREIVQNYDVDGIQFDDHFCLPVDYGYDALTIDVYKKEHGGRAPPAKATDPEWMQWRADKLTSLLARISREIKSIKPNIKLSISPNNYYFAYNKSLQDWKKWVEMGIVDQIVVQVYNNDISVFKNEITKPEIVKAKAKIPVGVGILTGLRSKPIPMSQITSQILSSRKENLSGVAFFFYETIFNSTEPKAARLDAMKNIFKEPARSP